MLNQPNGVKLLLAAQMDAIVAEETLKSGTGGLSAAQLGRLVLLATGDEKLARDAASKRGEDELIRDMGK